MSAYILRRILLMIPTLFGIMVLNFIIVQAAPGGPVERMVAQLTNITSADATARLTGAGSDLASTKEIKLGADSAYRGARGLDPEIMSTLFLASSRAKCRLVRKLRKASVARSVGASMTSR